MLWKDIKLATLKKIDPSITSLAPTRNTKDYLNAMVETTNRGLQDLSTAGKYITKKIIITQGKIKNILPMPLYMMNIYQHIKDDTAYSADGALAYYFEVDGTATVEIKVGGVVVETLSPIGRGFKAFKGIISNPEGKTAEIVFRGSYPYQYRNIALYDAVFEQEEDIWEYLSEKRYDLRELTEDFYRLVTTDLVLQSGFNERRYEKTSEYYWEGDSVLVLNGQQHGEWIVHYYAYPKEVTTETQDNDDIELDPEVAKLLAVYNAAELMEDEDIGKAQYFREQYEAGKAQLNPSQNLGQRATFVDANGW
ncbi:MAG: hypothetical protein PHE79_05100 [Eubacteriales bacterium]|nr:hypothetical protein [Eubacteriales bacterium]